MKRILSLFMLISTVVIGAQAEDSISAATAEAVVAASIEAESHIHSITVTPDESIFKVVHGSSGAEQATVSWSLDLDMVPSLEDQHVVIKYGTSIDAKRIKEKFKGVDWLYTDPVPLNDKKVTISGLKGNEKYEFYVGVAKTGTVAANYKDKTNMLWSGKVKAKTDRSWGISKLLILIGSLGMFIYGMKLMSDGLQQSAGSKLRQMLSSITSNRFSGMLTGFGTTAIVQSSSVTTVMVVSLVNAGLLNLRQAAGVMMGANIGTTITGFLILYLGFKVSIADYAYMIIAFGAPLLFMTFKKSKALSSSIIGFAILFIGLGALKDAVPELDKSSALVQFFIDYKDVWFGPLMFVFLGTLVTIIVQSSSAAMALTMTMVAKDIIPYEVACAMILGENIGTTVTAQLASIVGNVHAKRAATFHSLFNIIGVFWMIFLYPYALEFIADFVDGDPSTDMDAANKVLVYFHSGFNIVNMLLLIGFLPQLANLSERLVKSKGNADEEFKLDFIGGVVGANADISVLEAQKELAKFGKITAKMSGYVQELLFTQDKKQKTAMHNKIEKYEDITDRVEVEVTTYLEKVSRSEMSEDASVKVRGMLRISTNLERIGDIFFRISKTIERKDENQIWFSPQQREGVQSMLKLVDEAMVIMRDNLGSDYGSQGLQVAVDKEREINNFRSNLRKLHHESFDQKDFNIEGGMMYIDIISSLEKVGDHIINVSEAVAGEY